jgi:hypothetical protein
VRDKTFSEDQQKVRTGNQPAAWAAVRNLVSGLFRHARPVRQPAWNGWAALSAPDLMNGFFASIIIGIALFADTILVGAIIGFLHEVWPHRRPRRPVNAPYNVPT